MKISVWFVVASAILTTVNPCSGQDQLPPIVPGTSAVASWQAGSQGTGNGSQGTGNGPQTDNAAATNQNADSDSPPDVYSLKSPSSTVRQLRSDRVESETLLDIGPNKAWQDWKKRLQDRTGLQFSFDYHSLGALATDSLGDTGTASGVARFYGQWDLYNRDSKDSGSLVYKLESRHKYTPVAPNAFGSELGYVGTNYLTFNDNHFQVTHLFWLQHFAEGRGIWNVGFLDTTDFVDVYALGDPWRTFHNLAIGSGSATINLPNGALGGMLGGFLTDHLYMIASASDINGDPTRLFDGFDNFFNDFEILSTVEIGLTTAQDKMFNDNAHITLWNVDASEQAGTPSGWGVAGNLCKEVGKGWLPFLRGAWASRAGVFYESSVSFGVGYQPNPKGDLTAIGVNWGRPNRDVYGDNLGSQWTVEIFRRIQVTQQLEITPGVQLLQNPVLNPNEDLIGSFSLHVRRDF